MAARQRSSIPLLQKVWTHGTSSRLVASDVGNKARTTAASDPRQEATMKRITDKMRLAVALEAIEEISADAQSTEPFRDWKQSHDAVIAIYKIVHSIRSPKCRKNHPSWVEPIDAAIRAEAKSQEWKREGGK